MPPIPLTDTAVRSAKPQVKAVKFFDGGGLYLEVSPAAGKWWRWKYRFGAKEKRLSLGVYPDVSLKSAWEKRNAVRQQLATYLETHGRLHTCCAPSHPMTQGKIERYHRSIENVVKLEHYDSP